MSPAPPAPNSHWILIASIAAPIAGAGAYLVRRLVPRVVERVMRRQDEQAAEIGRLRDELDDVRDARIAELCARVVELEEHVSDLSGQVSRLRSELHTSRQAEALAKAAQLEAEARLQTATEILRERAADQGGAA